MKTHILIVAALAGAVDAETNAFGKDFLAKMRKEPGVIELPSGLMYKVLREGDGEEHPLADTSCECHYEGRTAQEYSKEPKGKKFDSSYDRGSSTSFAPSGVIKGWTEAMQLMVAGDKWEMYIPSELGYGDSGQGGDIGAGDVLVFTMEILKINGPTKPAERGPPPYAEFDGDAGARAEAFDAWSASSKPPLVLAVLRQPTASSKLFGGFKGAARAATKTDGAGAYALTASSKFEKGRYTTDDLAAQFKLSAPAVYTSLDGKKWKTCKTGRPTETTVEAIKGKIQACVSDLGVNKAEL